MHMHLLHAHVRFRKANALLLPCFCLLIFCMTRIRPKLGAPGPTARQCKYLYYVCIVYYCIVLLVFVYCYCLLIVVVLLCYCVVLCCVLLCLSSLCVSLHVLLCCLCLLAFRARMHARVYHCFYWQRLPLIYFLHCISLFKIINVNTCCFICIICCCIIAHVLMLY